MTIGILLSSILMSAPAATGNEAIGDASPFVMELKARDKLMAADAPIPLTVRLEYRGASPVTILSPNLLLDGMKWEVPSGWEPRPRPRAMSWSGVLPQISIQPHQSLEYVVYLQQYFSRILPGDVSLVANLEWAPLDGVRRAFRVDATIALHIGPPNPEALRARIHQMLARVRDMPAATERLLVYRSLEYIENPDVVRVMIVSLKDADAEDFHDRARKTIIRLASAYQKWDEVVAYLVDHGSRSDKAFFTYWKRNPGLSKRDVQKLTTAYDLWIRLYTLDVFGDPTLNRASTASLKAELKDLIQAVNQLPVESSDSPSSSSSRTPSAP